MLALPLASSSTVASLQTAVGGSLSCTFTLAEQVLEMTGARSELRFLPLPADDPKLRQPEIAVAKAELGWTPKVALREGLERTIPYFSALLDRRESA